MIVTRCPIRVSLAGGSTDLESYLQKYGYGTVISFSANLYCYISTNTDRLGINGLDKQYVVNYMNREVVNDSSLIKNDIARVVFEHYKIPPTTVWFTSDLYSSGSGLASSTAYLLSLIKSVQVHLGIDSSAHDLCKLAHCLEKKFNPLTGYQDPFACGTGGFNRFHFSPGGEVKVEKIDESLLSLFDMYLVSTGESRSSSNVLQSIDPEKCRDLIEITEEMHKSLLDHDSKNFLDLISRGWSVKKKTGKIIENEKVLSLDQILQEDRNVLAHRLLGAGNGGYFLVFAQPGSDIKDLELKIGTKTVKISVCNEGIKTISMGQR